jgi:hypothetical protein
MSPPIKLTYKQKQNKIITDKLMSYERELIKLKKTLSITDDPESWRWAALDIFKTLSNEFPNDNAKVIQIKEKALNIAREAQSIINYL